MRKFFVKKPSDMTETVIVDRLPCCFSVRASMRTRPGELIISNFVSATFSGTHPISRKNPTFSA